MCHHFSVNAKYKLKTTGHHYSLIMWQMTNNKQHITLFIVLTIIHEVNGYENVTLSSVWSPRLACPSSRILKLASDDIIGIWPGRLFIHWFQNLLVGNQFMTNQF